MARMNIIDIGKAEIDLRALGADDTALEMVLNNVRLYNNLIDDYELIGDDKNLYLTYQLNVQITKQFNELRKIHVLDKSKKSPGQTESPLKKLISEVNKPSSKQPKKSRK